MVRLREGQVTFDSQPGRTTGSFYWDPPVRNQIENIRKMRLRVLDIAENRAWDIADDLRAEMKENAPWTDRTGAARDALDAHASRTGDFIRVELFYNNLIGDPRNIRERDYSVYLETMQAGRFSIINPTIERNRGRIMRYYEGIM